MVFRFIFRFLSNNEQLIQRLSESYPIRRAAQLTIRLFYKGKQLTESSNVQNLRDFDLKSFLQRLASNVKEEIDEAKNEFKRRK